MLTNEEMEVLNRASEIISKYVSSGEIKSEAFNNFEQMVVSIIDRISKDAAEDGEAIECLFTTAPYHGGVSITKYNGFDEKIIHIPHSIGGQQVVAIEEKAFYKVDNIEVVEIPDGVISVGDSCFESCVNLRKVELPNTLKVIGTKAFSETSLNNVTIPNSVFYLGSYAFAKTPIEKLVLSTSLYSIPDSAFWCCKKLVDVFIPEGIIKLSTCSFSDCNNLSHITLPNSLTEISDQVFCNCSELKEIDIPPSVEKIGKNVFDGRYTVRPDRRYNPWTEYRKSGIVIKCVPGSFAQQYARANEITLARSEMVYKTDCQKNAKTYIIQKRTRWSFESSIIDSNTEQIIMQYLSGKDCEWAKVNSTTICIRSDNADIEKKANTYDSSVIWIRKAY